MAAAGSKSKKSAKKAGGKKSYAWIGILITALMICGAIFYIFLNNSSDKKDSNKGKSEGVTITKEDGRGNVKVETVKEKKKENPKSAPKTKPDNSKKDNNNDNIVIPKGNTVVSNIKSNKGKSGETPTDIQKVATENDKEKNDVTGGGDKDL